MFKPGYFFLRNTVNEEEIIDNFLFSFFSWLLIKSRIEMNLNCLNKTVKNIIKRLNKQIEFLETSNMQNF